MIKSLLIFFVIISCYVSSYSMEKNKPKLEIANFSENLLHHARLSFLKWVDFEPLENEGKRELSFENFSDTFRLMTSFGVFTISLDPRFDQQNNVTKLKLRLSKVITKQDRAGKWITTSEDCSNKKLQLPTQNAKVKVMVEDEISFYLLDHTR